MKVFLTAIIAVMVVAAASQTLLAGLVQESSERAYSTPAARP